MIDFRDDRRPVNIRRTRYMRRDLRDGPEVFEETTQTIRHPHGGLEKTHERSLYIASGCLHGINYHDPAELAAQCRVCTKPLCYRPQCSNVTCARCHKTLCPDCRANFRSNIYCRRCRKIEWVKAAFRAFFLGIHHILSKDLS